MGGWAARPRQLVDQVPPPGAHTLDHKKRHKKSQKRKFICEKCGKLYKKKQHIYRHRLQCLKKVYFPCNFCQHKFTRKNTLTTHQKLGRCKGVKSTICKPCERDFSTTWRLQRHNRSMHSNQAALNKAYPVCDRSSKTIPVFSDNESDDEKVNRIMRIAVNKALEEIEPF